MANQNIILGAILLVIYLFVPGYFLTLAFFPGKKEIDLLERFAFSIVFSITFNPLLVLLENILLSIPIEFLTIALNIIFLVLFGLIVYLGRIQHFFLPSVFYKVFPKLNKNEAFPIVPNIDYLKSNYKK